MLLKNSFYYSQKSLGVYERCPKMFEYIYIEGISGEMRSSKVKEKIERGVNFHILAERYFNGMKDYFYVEDPKLLEWMMILEREGLINLDFKSEFEIRQDRDEIRLMAKYDLIIREKNKIRIVDFKTNDRLYNLEVMEENIQTKVYMYLLGENLQKIFPKVELDDITMEYFQLNHSQDKIIIEYNEKKHKKNREIIKNIIGKIIKNNFSPPLKNIKTCEKCGFESFCK